MLTITMQCQASYLRSHRPLTLPSSRFPSSTLTSPKLMSALARNRLLMVRGSIRSDDEPLSNEFPAIPNKLFMQEAIGAEYGEGFETFRQDGPLKVDVDFLNEKLQEGFLQRIRYAMKPDEAYGLIFSWDNVVADTRSQKLNAWTKLASEEGLEIPEHVNAQKIILQAGAGHILLEMILQAGADHILLELLGREESELDRLKLRLSQLYHDNLLALSRPIDGLPEWLDAVSTARIPCGIVSCLDRKSMMAALEQMGLHKYFQVFVTEEDGMESMAHKYLSASMKLDRKPSKCVVFEDDPRGITAAHNCTMMAVALIGAHPAYELVQADLAVASFSELSVINLRRLFAHKGSGFMELQKQIVGKSPPKRKLNIDTIF